MKRLWIIVSNCSQRANICRPCFLASESRSSRIGPLGLALPSCPSRASRIARNARRHSEFTKAFYPERSRRVVTRSTTDAGYSPVLSALLLLAAAASAANKSRQPWSNHSVENSAGHYYQPKLSLAWTRADSIGENWGMARPLPGS